MNVGLHFFPVADISVFARSTFTFKNTHAAVFLTPWLLVGPGFPVEVSLPSLPRTRGLEQVGRALGQGWGRAEANFGLAGEGTGPVAGGKWGLGSLPGNKKTH